MIKIEKPWVGDTAEWFTCASTSNPEYHFDTAAGRYVVLFFFGSAALEKSRVALDFITKDLRHLFDDSRMAFFGVSVDPGDAEQNRVQQILPGFRYFWDFDGAVSKLYGALDSAADTNSGMISYSAFTLVLDPFLRVMEKIPLNKGDPHQHNMQLKEILEKLPPLNNYAGVPIHAPVLILPRVFEPDLCRTLIDLYKQNGGKESGFMREKDGYTVPVYDHDRKRRKDYNLEKDIANNPVLDYIRTRIQRRLIPEIKKVFQFDATRIERYIVSCYEGEVGGFFRAHRDDVMKGTMHRRFAVTLNLNTEEYEGGDLLFPEFGTHTYRAPTGGACVFSCSLLHEATPVTKGTRYAFLPFLYDDAAAKVRAENAKFLTGDA